MDKKVMAKTIHRSIAESCYAHRALAADHAVMRTIERAVAALIRSIRSGGTLLVFGNGGSAADAQHLAAELVGRFKKERRGLPAVSLTCNTSDITALANDYGYDIVFSRQVEAIGKKQDVALGISTSGSSRNVALALKRARSLGMTAIALTGRKAGSVAREATIAILAPADTTPRIQELHALICHCIAELIDSAFSH